MNTRIASLVVALLAITGRDAGAQYCMPCSSMALNQYGVVMWSPLPLPNCAVALTLQEYSETRSYHATCSYEYYPFAQYWSRNGTATGVYQCERVLDLFAGWETLVCSPIWYEPYTWDTSEDFPARWYIYGDVTVTSQVVFSQFISVPPGWIYACAEAGTNGFWPSCEGENYCP